MLTMAVGFALGWQKSAADAIVADAVARLQRAKAVNVTILSTTEEFPQSRRKKLSYRKGGYLRTDDGRLVYVSNPAAAWQYSPTEKTYRTMSVLTKDLSILQVLGLSDILNANLPILSGPTATTWHGMRTQKIEFDGRKAMTKETKLFVYFSPTTRLPLGISANLGSVTQVIVFEALQLDPKLESQAFAFTPPRDWKRRKP